MKRLFALFLTQIIIMGLFSIVPVAEAAKEVTNEYSWVGTSQVYSASKGARYFRTKVLSDGTIGAVYYRGGMGNYFAKSYDGGLTFTDEVCLIKNATDSEITDSPFVSEEYPLGRGRLEAQNPNFVEAEDGTLWVFHRYNTFTGSPTEKPWSFYYASICYQKSTDGGKNWTTPQVMVECQREKALDDTKSDYGFWEPDPYIINGKLFVYYADTHTPNNLNYQHIMYCVFDEKTGAFSAPKIAQNGINHKSRDGMSVVTRLNDGSYAMVFESTKTGNTDNTFVIKMSVSRDGCDWSHPVIIASPNKVLAETAAASSEKAVCASPHIITLPDGRVAVSYQTTDRYSGIVPDRVSYRVGTQVIVSKEALSYENACISSDFADETEFVNATHLFKELDCGPGTLKEGEISKSASLLYTNGYLLVYYNIGSNANAYTHTIGAINVSYAKTSKGTDYQKIENYTTFNTNNQPITELGGEFTLPSSTSTLLSTDKCGETALSDLYNADNYTFYKSSSYKASFDSVNETLSTVNTGKAMLNNTEDMTEFTASVTVKGNTSTGAIQGGFGFHLQKGDFDSNYFNTSGYSVFVRRIAGSLNKAEIVYRYCTGGENVHSYVAGTYTLLDASDLDTRFTLKLFVNKDKFYALLLNEKGEVIINAKEAPLNETKSGKSKYYPVGSIAIINHGTHTFSNISITKTANLIKTDYLRAKGIFTMSASGDNQFGFAFRAQGSVNASPGYSGYVVKLVKTDAYDNGIITLQLTRYGTNSQGTKFVNLGNMKTYTDTTVLNGVNASGATVIMEAEVEGTSLTVTLKNPDNTDIYSTYSFNLTAASGSYSNYYESGGFGIFNHSGAEVSVKGLEFSTVKEKKGSLNTDNFDTYTSDGTLETYDGAFTSTKETVKKAILKDSISEDFTANATFTIGTNGKINSGILFRVQDVGEGTYESSGYLISVIKTGSTSNKGRVKLELAKYVRKRDGGFTKYLKTTTESLMNYYDTVTLNSAMPEAETSMLASADTRIRINLEVKDNIVTTNFDIVDDSGNVLSSCKEMTYNLTTDLTTHQNNSYSYEGANTLYGAGDVGAFMGRLGDLCDFNFTPHDTASLDSKLIYTSHNHNGIAFNTLNSGAAESGSEFKVNTVPNEGCILSHITVTINGNTTEIIPTKSEHTLTKQDGKTFVNAVFRILGDISGDDKIDAYDITIMRKFLLGNGTLRSTDGDVNQNGAVDLKDLVRLKKSAAGITEQ